jgi:dolichyl-phosphate-mannose-protein mannosyltransferase
LIPILFYMTMFQLHFAILGSSGEGDAFMSSEFRQTLGHGMQDTYAGRYSGAVHVIVLIHFPIDVALGSEITIRHLNTQGGYLHSHAHNYPGGSGRTCCA